MTPSVPAPPPPSTLSVGAANYADLLANLVRDTGNAEWIDNADALSVLQLRGNLRVAQRVWEEQWTHYERELVVVIRRAGVPDAEIARALGVERQNLHRVHGKRGEA